MKPKPRIKNLSTRFFLLYKYGVIILAGAIILFFSWTVVTKSGNIFDAFMPLYWVWLIYLWIRVNQKVFQVEFDEDFLYIIKKRQDTMIPLENIKDVEIVSMGGVYLVDLYIPEDFGVKLYFKPSLLYPFNFKKKDALVNVLRSSIERAKQKKKSFQKNALHS